MLIIELKCGDCSWVVVVRMDPSGLSLVFYMVGASENV